MPQINDPPGSGIFRRFRDIERRLHALEVTVPTLSDSIYVTTQFDQSSGTYAPDTGFGDTQLLDINCYGSPDAGTNVLVAGSCQIGLDAVSSPASYTEGGDIAVMVDGGTTVEPGSGPGIYFLAQLQVTVSEPSGGTIIGMRTTAAGSRVVQVLAPADTDGLSTHDFAMVFRSTSGQTIHFENRTLAVNPQ